MLSLEHSVIAANTTISLGGISASAGGGISVSAGDATIDADGYNVNFGTITNTAFNATTGPFGAASTLTIDVGGRWCAALLVNAGTLSVTAGVVSPSTMVVHADSRGAALLNQGTISSDGFIKLDIDVIGQGKIAFGAIFSLGHDGPPAGATVEIDRALAAGQTVDFGTGVSGPYATGTDSHGALILDDPGDFRGLIANFVASAGNFGEVHPDEIVLQGTDVTAFRYRGDAQGGVLTLREGCETVARLRFAGSYTTDMFQVTHPSATSSVIELKPTV